MKKTKLLLIYTGGTIGMVHDSKTGQLKPFNFKYLANQIPELEKFDLIIDTYSFKKPIDSSNMQPEVWVQLSEIIHSNYNKYDGFVVLHGSDTMSYTASALSFMFENLNKPVILTGSQLPIGIRRTDGKENLITAIEIASLHQKGKPVFNEVCIYFEYKLYRGNRTHKYNAENFQAFQSPNYPELAEAGVNITFNKNTIRKSTGKKFKVNNGFNTNVAVLKIFPGISKEAVKAVTGTSRLRGLIIETFGAGNASTEKWFIDEIKKAVQKGIIVLNITQCNAGSVVQGKYETSTELKKAGVVGGADMTFEAAVTKMMYLLGNYSGSTQIKKQLQQSIRGELTEK